MLGEGMKLAEIAREMKIYHKALFINGGIYDRIEKRVEFVENVK